ncbi:hypothetical protein GW17_00044161 [Ensete ventricosum]|uniref:Uncharacterized protein n=1 Tax=Ensete ventricosum TaxID=4639 RepID=A0A427AJK7_ENSVE|nr:hypothetical protein B296_00016588 [Ensete ventricosum]RWV93381.1 hypothetical protein GW17_00044161 [Ensete ventricosum]
MKIRSLTLHKVTRKVSFRSVFRAPSRNLKKLVIPNNFKILAILDVLANEKSYVHDFRKNATLINFA